jgi:uncharacterized protein (TIGR02599 family)
MRQCSIMSTKSKKSLGFTLVEVMVSMSLLLVMMLVITEVISQAQKSWKSAASRVSQFRQARQAFDIITHGLRQAKINPILDYYYEIGGRVPRRKLVLNTDAIHYEDIDGPPIRFADLEFISGNAANLFSSLGSSADMVGDGVLFQGPFGLTNDPVYKPLYNALCARGYFVQFGHDQNLLPLGLVDRLQPKFRYRLYEFRQATEHNQAFANIPGAPSGFRTLSPSTSYSQPIADNIVCLIFAPMFGNVLGDDGRAFGGGHSLNKQLNSNIAQYDFDSLNDSQRKTVLPKAIRCVAFAIDEETADRLALQSGNSQPTLLRQIDKRFNSVSQSH